MATFQEEAWIRRQKEGGLYVLEDGRGLCPKDPDLPVCLAWNSQGMPMPAFS